jgi:transposase
MDAQLDLFTRALGLAAPWQVVGVDFDAAERRLELRVDFPPGARFPCPESGEPSPVHDSAERTWRHLDFFQHQAYLVARVPRVRCPDGAVRTVEVPWARPGSGFTLLFEALVMTLAAEMPVRAMAKLVAEHDTRLWRVIHHYVDAAWAAEDWSAVTRIGLDETSFRRGQDYVSVFADLDRRRVVYAIEGRDAPVVAGFAAELHAHGGQPEQVAEVCQDMSAAYREGVAEHPARGPDHLRPLPSRKAHGRGRRPGAPRRARRARRAPSRQPLPVAAPARDPLRPPARAPRRPARGAASGRARLSLAPCPRRDL